MDSFPSTLFLFPGSYYLTYLLNMSFIFLLKSLLLSSIILFSLTLIFFFLSDCISSHGSRNIIINLVA